MKKVVLNKCYGGFGLSYKAVRRFAELKDIDLYVYQENIMIGEQREMERIRDESDVESSGILYYYTAPLKEVEKLNGKEREEKVIRPYELDRDDEDLVQVVEELGAEANGNHASLMVVEIPDDVDWEITEYDGKETLREKHRSW